MRNSIHPFRRPVLRLILISLFSIACIGSIARVHAQETPATPPTVDDAWTSVVIELGAPSAADVYIAESAAAADASGNLAAADAARITEMTAAQVAAISDEQDAFAATLDTLGAIEIYRTQRVYNGIAVRLPLSALPALLADVRVLAVHPLIAKTLDNARSIPLIGAPTFWDAPFALTGDGVRIGIIDTGADYLHVGLGGPGTGYAQNDVTVTGDVIGFPNARVVGGYDFVGDTYNANPTINPYQPVPQPDPDPIDCYGHGSHVAGSAAGNGVTTAGVAYAGPYTSGLEPANFRIGPGVAPRADIYALKVFGCIGSSEVVDLAVEWAIDPNSDGNFGDHLDIINLSLGSPYGRMDDTTSLAVDRAAQVGIIVVSSMGNNGDNFFITGSPGAGARVVTVAATRVDASASTPGRSQTDTLAPFSSRGPRLGDNLLKPDLAAPGAQIVSVASGSGNDSLTISGTSMATPMVAGALALLQQRHPLWDAEQLKALLMSTAMGALRFDDAFTGTQIAPTRSGAGRIDLASALRSEILALSPDTPGAVALNFGAPEVFGNSNLLRNLRIQNVSGEARTLIAEYRPVIDLPGVDVSIANALTGTATITVASASSLSVPVLLALDANAITNVIDPALVTTQAGAPRQWRSEEQGHVWLWDARGIFTANLSGSQAMPPSPNTATATANIVYVPATRVLSYTIVSAIDTSTVETITVERGLAGWTLDETAHTLFARGGGPAVTLPLTGAVTLDARDSLLLASGYLQVKIDGSGGAIAGPLVAQEPVIKTPLFVAPRPVAAMRALSSTIDVGAAATLNVTLPLTGTPLTGSVFPTDTQSLVGAFELHARSPQKLPDVNFRTPAYADIQYVGISSDYLRVTDKSTARIFIALSTWGEWSTPWQTQFVVNLDINEDNISDYRITSTDMTALGNAKNFSDAFITAVENQRTSGNLAADPLNVYPPDKRLTAIFQNNVVVLSAPISLLGLSPTNPNFRFRVETLLRSPAPDEYGDQVDWMRFDMLRPALAVRNMPLGSPWLEDLPSTQILLSYNLAHFTRNMPLGILLIHPFNALGSRAETVNVDFTWPYVRPLPLITTMGF